MKKTLLALAVALMSLCLNALATSFVQLESEGPYCVTNSSGYIDVYAQMDGAINTSTQRIAISYPPFYNDNPSWITGTIQTTPTGDLWYRLRIPHQSNTGSVDREGSARIDLQNWSSNENAWVSSFSSSTWFYHTIYQFRSAVANSYQTTINNAANNSTVNIASGTYLGNLTINNKSNLVIQGSGISAGTSTQIKGTGHSSTIILNNCTNVTIKGMIITNGAGDNGGAINCYNSSVTLEGCLIKNNHSRSLYSGGTLPVDTKGGAIFLGYGTNSCTVKSSIIMDNYAQDANTAYVTNGSLTFENCNLLEANAASNYTTYASPIQFWNSIISSANVNNSNFYYCCSYNPAVTLPGVNNLSTINPLFTDVSVGDYTLQKGSPCIGMGYNLLYDDPLVTGYDQSLRTMKDETQDIGAVNFAWDRYASYTFTNDTEANWMCFPVVDDNSTVTIGGTPYTTDVMKAFFNQYNPTPSPMVNVSYRWYGSNGFNTYWHSPSNPITATVERYLGYKALFNQESTMPATGAIHGYQIPYNTPVPVPEPNTENWIGYFLPETQTPQAAFGSFMDELYLIQHKDWAFARLKPKRGSTWIGVWNNGQRQPTLSYGDMVIVKKFGESVGYPEVEEFTWARQQPVPEYQKSEAQNFSFAKEPSYKPIFVEVDSLTTAKEIAVMIDGNCYGAAVVEGNIVMIQAYIESIPEGAEIQLVSWDGAKAQAAPLAMQVYDRNEDVFRNCASLINQDCDFYYVKIGGSSSGSETPTAPTLSLTNYPNPFNPVTTISYSVPKDAKVLLSIYNTKGQLVRTLVNGTVLSGTHRVVWNGADDNGNKVSSGIYFSRIQTEGKSLTTKMLMLK